jgi:superfamily II DNA or RNA helicase
MSTYEINGYLNNYGLCIKKKKINNQINVILDKFFSVKPELNYENDKINDADKYFKVYYSDSNYLVLPKFSTNITIDISKYINLIDKNDKKTILINNIEYSKIIFKISKYKYKNELSKFNFKGKLRDYQQVIIDEIFKKFGLEPTKPSEHHISQSFPKGGLIKLSCGGGKCLGLNTPVLMYDGTIKMVQDIEIGDKLMGDDSKPRNIIKLARGQELMYQILQSTGESYIVNSSHILSLYDPKKNIIVDISVQDYLNLPDKYMGPNGISLTMNSSKKYMLKGGLYGFKVNIKFSLKEIPFEPYFYGEYLMSGLELCDYYSESELDYIAYNDRPNYTNKIPNNYKMNHYSIQLKLLAGIIDKIGIVNNDSDCDSNYDSNSYSIEIINKQLQSDIIFILRSLGLKYLFDEQLNKITIYDKYASLIPTEVKKINLQSNLHENYFNDKNINYYKISIKELKEDNYYGFEIDGNRRFLLGDFTVTHNTMLAIYLSWVLGLKTLVVTNKEFLMDQWEERIKQFTDAKVGKIRQDIIDVENKDIVVGMLRSLSIKDYPTEILQQFGLVIYDEVHHTGSRVDSQALLKTSAQYTLGLSATPERPDGMTKVINWHLGNILYEMEKKYNYRLLVKKIYFRSNDSLFREKKMWFQGRFAPNHTSMTENITKIKTRNQLIVNMIDVLKGMGRKILVLSYRVEHLELLKKMVDDKIKLDGETHIYNSYFYMGKTKRGEKKLAEKDGHIIFATMQLAEEGLDISHLDTVIFALPVSIQKDKKNNKIKSSKTLIQSIGRILRNDKLEDLTQIPLVIDLSDMFSIYSSWSNKRNEIYGKKNWYIQNFYWEDLEFLNSSSISSKETNKITKPMNVMFDDITDEDFIEKNLLISDEEANNMLLQDKYDEQNDNTESSSLSDNLIKNNKTIKQTKIEEIIDNEEIKPIKYCFGKKKV